MSANTHTIRCVILCKSAADVRAVEALAMRKVALDTTVEDKTISFSGGVEARGIRRFVLRDLFDKVEVQSDRAGNDKSFGLIFHTRAGADRFWGDVVERVLRSISREASASVRIESVT